MNNSISRIKYVYRPVHAVCSLNVGKYFIKCNSSIARTHILATVSFSRYCKVMLEFVLQVSTRHTLGMGVRGYVCMHGSFH